MTKLSVQGLLTHGRDGQKQFIVKLSSERCGQPQEFSPPHPVDSGRQGIAQCQRNREIRLAAEIRALAILDGLGVQDHLRQFLDVERYPVRLVEYLRVNAA